MNINSMRSNNWLWRCTSQTLINLAKSVACCLALSCLMASQTALGVPEDCSAGESEPLKACEQKLNDAQADMLYELENLIDAMQETPGLLDAKRFGDANVRSEEQNELEQRLARMQRQHTQAMEAISESENREFEEAIVLAGKQKGEQCLWKEAPEVEENPLAFLPAGFNDPDDALGNGECDSFNAYSEDLDRYITINERSQPNICARICDDKYVPEQYAQVASASTGTRVSDRIRSRYIRQRSEGIDATVDLTEAIYTARQELIRANAMFELQEAEQMRFMADTAGAADNCLASAPIVQQRAWVSKQVLVPVLLVTKVASRVLEFASDVAWVACQQSAGGFHTSLLCVGGVVAKGLGQAAVDLVEYGVAQADLVIEHNDLYGADTTYDCVDKIRKTQNAMFEKIKSLETSSGKVDADLSRLKALILQNREYIKNNRELLLTPFYYRPGVPVYEAPDQN